MKLMEAIKNQSGSLRQFALDTNVSYAVLHDLCSGKKQLKDCRVLTVLRIAKGLNTTIDELIEKY